MSLIKEIVNNLPYLLIYYVPGFCTIFAYRRFRSARSFAMSETVHLGACVVMLHNQFVSGGSLAYLRECWA